MREDGPPPRRSKTRARDRIGPRRRRGRSAASCPTQPPEEVVVVRTDRRRQAEPSSEEIDRAGLAVVVDVDGRPLPVRLGQRTEYATRSSRPSRASRTGPRSAAEAADRFRSDVEGAIPSAFAYARYRGTGRSGIARGASARPPREEQRPVAHAGAALRPRWRTRSRATPPAARSGANAAARYSALLVRFARRIASVVRNTMPRRRKRRPSRAARSQTRPAIQSGAASGWKNRRRSFANASGEDGTYFSRASPAA